MVNSQKRLRIDTLSVVQQNCDTSRNGQQGSRLVVFSPAGSVGHESFTTNVICNARECICFSKGGKAYGLLKDQQEEKLNHVNEVR